MIVANWKMHKTIGETVTYITEMSALLQDSAYRAFVAVPHTSLWMAAQRAKGTAIVIGAQNCSQHSKGAYTGEVSAQMIADAGAQFVILGHSERRILHGESSSSVNLKLKRALAERLQPIVCIGESLEERRSGLAMTALENQMAESLAGLTADELSCVTLAYEPVWAIGTGEAASLEIVEQVHRHCKQYTTTLTNSGGRPALPILYGGSVTAENSGDFLRSTAVDGLLVGTASLSVTSFSQIVHSLRYFL